MHADEGLAAAAACLLPPAACRRHWCIHLNAPCCLFSCLLQALAWPILYAREAEELGVRWPRGLLLHGPPGCGKTAAVLAVAAECGAALHHVTAASIVGAYTGAC